MGKRSLIDCIITVRGEKVQGLGEDSAFAAYLEPLGVLGVFDGCGGIGARKYPAKDNKSGAYLASRGAMAATERWFSGVAEVCKAETDALAESLKQGICAELERLTDGGGIMKGSLVCEFPTTVSVILMKQLKNAVNAVFLWAGDSRSYVLEPAGLVQLTRDDIVGGGDAYMNLREDARLSNFAKADGKFSLGKRFAEISAPAMLICATDGCFGYFKTPMEFEYIILEALEEAESFADWKNALTERIGAVSGDDFSMNICLIGCEDIKRAKKLYKRRRKYLLKSYISKLENARHEELQELWNKYKIDYYK